MLTRRLSHTNCINASLCIGSTHPSGQKSKKKNNKNYCSQWEAVAPKKKKRDGRATIFGAGGERYKLEVLWTVRDNKKRPKRKQHRYNNQARSKIRPRAKSWKLLFCQWLLPDHRKRRKGISTTFLHIKANFWTRKFKLTFYCL